MPIAAAYISYISSYLRILHNKAEASQDAMKYSLIFGPMYCPSPMDRSPRVESLLKYFACGYLNKITSTMHLPL